jgi:hypothetical protein
MNCGIMLTPAASLILVGCIIWFMKAREEKAAKK